MHIFLCAPELLLSLSHWLGLCGGSRGSADHFVPVHTTRDVTHPGLRSPWTASCFSYDLLLRSTYTFYRFLSS